MEMLVDEVKISVREGKCGNGSVTFGEHRMVNRPVGGDGGNGGSVYIEATTALGDLSRYRYAKVFVAPNGENGGRNSHGVDGADVILSVPRGTVVKNLTSGEPPFEMLSVGERMLVGKGGLRGRGNALFLTQEQLIQAGQIPGKNGYGAELELELQLIADIGLVGLPNAGKSSLLNAVTAAKSKVADYKFTTLEPHLGVLPSGALIADIPGLIEGAAEGRGLGAKFLRHIKRTKLIAHLVSFESEDIKKDYETIRGELSRYDKKLADKDEILLITKADIASPSEKNLPSLLQKIK